MAEKDKKIPIWHYVGMTGIPEWFSKVHRDIIFDRIKLAIRANHGDEKKMRYCHNCEVGLGTLTRKQYEVMYIDAGMLCKKCGHPAYNKMALLDGEPI